MKWKGLLFGVALLACASCAADRSQRRPYLIQENLDYAAKHQAAGDKEEAAQLYEVVLLADPFNEKARTSLAGIGDYDRSVMEPSLLGKNYVSSPVNDSMTLRIVMYPVNRVLSILYVFSFGAGLEGGAYVDTHVTHAMQVAAGGGGGVQLGWWQKHELAVGTANQAGLALGPFSVEGEGATRVGTNGAGSNSFSVVGMSRPSDTVYQKNRDYWGIGARATLVVVSVEAEFHPAQFANAITSFFFLDFLRDDIGGTKSLHLERYERDAMEDLLGTVSPADLRERMQGRAIPPPPETAPAKTEPVKAAPAKNPAEAAPPKTPPVVPAPQAK